MTSVYSFLYMAEGASCLQPEQNIQKMLDR